MQATASPLHRPPLLQVSATVTPWNELNRKQLQKYQQRSYR